MIIAVPSYEKKEKKNTKAWWCCGGEKDPAQNFSEGVGKGHKQKPQHRVTDATAITKKPSNAEVISDKKLGPQCPPKVDFQGDPTSP